MQPQFGPSAPRSGGTGLAATSLVLGILSIPLICCLVSPLTGLAAIIFGAVHLRRSKEERWMAIGGIATGAFGGVMGVALILLSIFAFPNLSNILSSTMVAQFQPYLNKPAPPFTLPDIDGRTHTLNQYQGRVVLINFWASW